MYISLCSSAGTMIYRNKRGSLIGAKGKKDEKIRKDIIVVYMGGGLLLY